MCAEGLLILPLAPRLTGYPVYRMKLHFLITVQGWILTMSSATAPIPGLSSCRVHDHSSPLDSETLLPASAYGAFKCDTPYDLALAALQAVGALTGGTGKDREHLAFTLYTGDLASHDPQDQLSRLYTEYVDTAVAEERCRMAKICYMRSGSEPLARACTPG